MLSALGAAVMRGAEQAAVRWEREEEEDMETEKTTRELTMDADMRALLPRMGAEEREALRQDIQARGMDYAILVDEHDVIIDGHHRYEAARSCDPVVPYEVKVYAGLSEDEKRAMARAVNIYRRHMTKAERRPVLETLHSEGYSTRSIAEMAGVPYGTVARDFADWSGASGEAPDQPATAPTEAQPAPTVAAKSAKRVKGRDGKMYAGQRATPEDLVERRTKVKSLLEGGQTYRQVAKALQVGYGTVAGDAAALRAGTLDAPRGRASATERSLKQLPASLHDAARAQIERHDVVAWVARLEGAVEVMPPYAPEVIARHMPPDMRRRWAEQVPRFMERLTQVGTALEAETTMRIVGGEGSVG